RTTGQGRLERFRRWMRNGAQNPTGHATFFQTWVLPEFPSCRRGPVVEHLHRYRLFREDTRLRPEEAERRIAAVLEEVDAQRLRSARQVHLDLLAEVPGLPAPAVDAELVVQPQPATTFTPQAQHVTARLWGLQPARPAHAE